jgi:hypothetical protein
MLVAQAAPGGGQALALAGAITILYLVTVRLMDLNEKEPLWALSLVFSIGVVAAFVLNLAVDSRVLELATFAAASGKDVAKFIGLLLGLAAFAGVARRRGWSEITGLTDGVVYGAAVGLGFAAGSVFVREIVGQFGTAGDAFRPGVLGTLWPIAVLGLSEGLFGAVIGTGFGAAVEARSAPVRVLWPLGTLAVAILTHGLYLVLVHGNALGRSHGLVRTWVGLALPLVFVAAVMAVALRRERRSLRHELADERELDPLGDRRFRSLQRRAVHIEALLSGDFDRWLALRALHNRHVQLALIKRRARRERDPHRRARLEMETATLQASIHEIRRSLDEGTQPNTVEVGR